MRERLAVSFVLLAVLLLAVAGVARAAAVGELVNEQARADVRRDARLFAVLLAGRERRGEAIDEEYLAQFVDDETALTLRRAGVEAVTEGPGFQSSADDLVATATRGDVTVTVRRSPERLEDLLGRNLTSLLLVLAGLVLLAAVLGILVARRLSAPFRQLALAASTLGAGRYDPELPRSSMPEVRAISRALRASAAQIEQGEVRDREFVRQASHVLRTPVAGLRADLEELGAGDADVETRRLLTRAAARLDELDAATGELVSFARDGRVADGGRTTLRDLAHHVGERWRAALPAAMEVHAHAVAGADLELSSGPLEQVLDLVLTDVSRRNPRTATLRFTGEPGTVRVAIVVVSPLATPGSLLGLAPATELVTALGGRIRGDLSEEGGVTIQLPA